MSRTYVPPQTDYSVILGEPSKKIPTIKVINSTEYDMYIGDGLFIQGFKTMLVNNTKEVKKLLKEGMLEKL